jgi:hypothetical protein
MKKKLRKSKKKFSTLKHSLGFMLLLFSVLFIYYYTREDHSEQRAAQLKRILRDFKAGQAELDKAQDEMIILYKGKIELILHENTTSEIYDPCGDGPGPDEVILKIVSGKFVAYFERINNEFFSLMPDGTYQTRDQDACTFNIKNGIVEL